MVMAIQTIIRGLAVGIFAVLSLVPVAAVATHQLWPSLYPTNNLLTAPVAWPARFNGAFPSQFEQWLTDHVRRTLPALSINAAYQVGLLRQSSDRRIVLARSGWLFWTDGDDTETATMANFRGRLRFTNAQVQQAQRHLLVMRDALAACNIRALVAVAPNKQSIYGEKLSGDGETAETELDDLLPRLELGARSLLLDLRPPLRAAKAQHPELPLYYKTDSHWNLLGAYYGYSAIMAELAKTTPIANLQLTSRDRYKIAVTSRPPGDLAQMLAASAWFTDAEVEERPIIDAAAPPGAGRLLILGDSFSERLIPYFRPHFSTVQFRHFPSPPASVGDKPSVILFGFVERYLLVLTLHFDWSQFCTP